MSRQKRNASRKNSGKGLENRKKVLPLHSLKAVGVLTEWLGNGLQNRLQQFESARHLNKKGSWKSSNCLLSYTNLVLFFFRRKPHQLRFLQHEAERRVMVIGDFAVQNGILDTAFQCTYNGTGLQMKRIHDF